MSKLTKRSQSKVARRKSQIRDTLWPNLEENKLWRRELSDGWLSVPRVMPLMLRIMDMLAPKGKPVSQTYLDLWCRTYDDSFVIVNKPREMAYFSGFTGERAETTWATRVRSLHALEFIDVKEGVHPINYILVYNPYLIIQKHYVAGRVQSAAYHAFREKLVEVGADDLQEQRIAEMFTSTI